MEFKGELKEELKKELVTREIFEERFKRMELWFKIMIAVMIFGFFVFNPDFIDLIKIIFG